MAEPTREQIQHQMVNELGHSILTWEGGRAITRAADAILSLFAPLLVMSTRHMREAADDLERSRGEYRPPHRWAGDGTDDLDTITTDVLITPEQLLSLTLAHTKEPSDAR